MQRNIFAICFLFSACSMIYYLLHSKLIAEMTGDIVLWGSVSSATYLCALGIGLLLSDKRSELAIYQKIGRIELALSSLAPLSVISLYLLHMIYRVYLYDFGYFNDETVPRSAYFAIIAQLSLMGLGLLSGLEAGYLNKLSIQVGLHQLQRLIATYYLGGLLGSLVFMLVLTPHFEPLLIIYFAAFCNLLGAGYWLFRYRNGASRSWALSLSGVTLLLLSSFLISLKYELVQVHRKNFYYNRYRWSMDSQGLVTYDFPDNLLEWWKNSRKFPNIERYFGPYQNIDFVTSSDQDSWSMMMDGRFQVSSVYAKDYHETLAHVPSILQDRVGKQILVIGGGDGLLIRELLRFEQEIEQITLVDIDPKILELGQFDARLSHFNQGSLTHQKVKLVRADAFQFLRNHTEQFDRIYLDVLYPFNSETARLFTVEFLGSAMKRLNPGGSMAMLSPIELEKAKPIKKDEVYTILLSTIKASGCKKNVLFAEERHSFLLCLPNGDQLINDQNYQNSRYYQKVFADNQKLQFQILEPVYYAKYVNSILKPIFHGRPDSFF